MTGAEFILAINLFVAGLLAAAFLAIAAYDKRREPARWIALSYTVGMLTYLVELTIASFGTSIGLVLSSFGSLLAALFVFNVGIAHKYSVSVPSSAMYVVFSAALATCYLIQDMPRDSFVRMLLYQLPYGIMQLIAAAMVVRAKARTALDNLLAGLLVASAVQFLSKPFLFQSLGGTGARPDLYVTTTYAMLSQSVGTVFAMAIALTLLVILVRDVLSDAHERSETDMLSGLLNRRGFERHAATAIRDAVRTGSAVSLVISDIDHFKSVNDSFGHAAGDKVIVAFARYLQASIARHQLCGRLGGEEFAVLMPATNVVAARLFAEAARSDFAAMAVEGLPGEKRFTASFGVAELAPGETIHSLVARADEALYLAKNSGRDCVKIAPRPRRAPQDQQTAVSLA
jgi:diguanylate cyclase (GGDEF)-like protein